MTGATNKNAPLAGQGINGKQVGITNNSIPQHEIGHNKLPEWIQKKVITIVKKRAKAVGCTQNDALQLVSGEAFVMISAELSVTRTQLPDHLAKALMDDSFSALDALEIAALIITEADAQACAPACDPQYVAEFTALKLEALREFIEGVQDGLR